MSLQKIKTDESTFGVMGKLTIPHSPSPNNFPRLTVLGDVAAGWQMSLFRASRVGDTSSQSSPAAEERKAEENKGVLGDASEAAEQLPRPFSIHKVEIAKNAGCNLQCVRKSWTSEACFCL